MPPKNVAAASASPALVAPDHIKSLSRATKLTEDGLWWYGPAFHDVEKFEIVQQTYRRLVERFLEPLKTVTKLGRKRFFTISTNVLMALDRTASDYLNDCCRDLYKPLEIAVCKWSIEDGIIDTKHWNINPGGFEEENSRFGYACAQEHAALHKIDLGVLNDEINLNYSNDYKKIFSEIYDFIGPDRTVFSCSLKHVRQDIGSLKWLLHQGIKAIEKPKCEHKYKPINVYSLRDLFVVLARRYANATNVGKGVADRVLNAGIYEELDNRYMCIEHQEDYQTENCALTQALMKSIKSSEKLRVLRKENTLVEDENAQRPSKPKKSDPNDEW